MGDTELKKTSGMTVKEVAFVLDVSPKTVYSWCYKGLIDHYRIKGTIRIYPQEVKLLRNSS